MKTEDIEKWISEGWSGINDPDRLVLELYRSDVVDVPELWFNRPSSKEKYSSPWCMVPWISKGDGLAGMVVRATAHVSQIVYSTGQLQLRMKPSIQQRLTFSAATRILAIPFIVRPPQSLYRW